AHMTNSPAPPVLGQIAQRYGITDGTWISIGEASALLQVSAPTLRRWAAEELISSRPLSRPGSLQYLKEELQQVLQVGRGRAPSVQALRHHLHPPAAAPPERSQP
ncbi:hypothetical protein ACSNOI_46755, partial [Actinomadura kijaniata]